MAILCYGKTGSSSRLQRIALDQLFHTNMILGERPLLPLMLALVPRVAMKYALVRRSIAKQHVFFLELRRIFQRHPFDLPGEKYQRARERKSHNSKEREGEGRGAKSRQSSSNSRPS